MTKDKKSHSVGIHEISFCIAMLFVSVLTIVQPLLLKRLFDNLSNRDIIIQAIVFYGASIILLLFFEYIHKISAAKISQRVTRRIRDRMTSSFLEDRHIDVNADLVATLNVDLNSNIKDFLESYYLNKLSIGVWFFSLLLYFAAIIYVDIAMAVLVVLTNVAVLLIPFITQKKTKILKNRLLLSLEAFNSKYFDVIRGINILKLTHAVLPQLKRIDRVSESNLSIQYTSDKYRNSVDVVIGAVSFAGTFSIILYGVIAITQQKLSIGAVFASIQFADLISLPLINLTSALHRLNGGKAIKERFDALYPPSHLPESVSKKLTSNTEAFEQLEMSNIAFSYSEDSEDVLRIDRLRIERGDKILLMGENGSGKSTLLKLLLIRNRVA
ncbi:MAG TPA: ABC transporter ATP-binding protein [Fastidiosipila sp.]|nr:ABC transporter ATP-binding protein [Fastidiosipila sp.]